MKRYGIIKGSRRVGYFQESGDAWQLFILFRGERGDMVARPVGQPEKVIDSNIKALIAGGLDIKKEA